MLYYSNWSCEPPYAQPRALWPDYFDRGEKNNNIIAAGAVFKIFYLSTDQPLCCVHVMRQYSVPNQLVHINDWETDSSHIPDLKLHNAEVPKRRLQCHIDHAQYYL